MLVGNTLKKQMGRKYPKKWVIITATQTTQEMGHYYLIYVRVEVTIKLMVKIDMNYGCNNP